MKRLYLVALLGIGALALAGCRRGGGLGGNPEVMAMAMNQGADLMLTWKSVEGANGYRVYCDGNKIWEGKEKDTTYTIMGSSRVCEMVEVSAFSGKDEQKTKIDLMPKSSTITGLVSHDGTGNSWVKLDFNNGMATSVRQTDVDKNASNIGWFVFFNAGSGNVQFKDASATSVGRAKMEVAFTDNMSSGFLAPGKGSYNTVRNVSSGGRYFFWADNTSTGYDMMDNNDYFGVIKVTSISGMGPYMANLEIYIQNKVPGLRWVVIHSH
jgi:hypothetical protein